ncbi:MAG: hypothetical protein AMJ65_11400 [Phycisphaerae bacterium SG8_4]|nr:MAG: hypothetical protein AMJ65_11400 [Phycisphaerae bacterium SG8_4]
MVAAYRADNRLIDRVAEIYDWLDSQIRRGGSVAGACKCCGNCCDFDSYDHRLFVTLPELMYLTVSLGTEKIKAMPAGRCPYNIDGKCGIHEHRFAGCRIFCCSGDAAFQSELSEAVLAKLKSVCAEFRIPYRYVDLARALNDPANV